MNLIDNGIEEVVNIERVNTEDTMCFRVTFTDYYNQQSVKDFMTIKNIENVRWVG